MLNLDRDVAIALITAMSVLVPAVLAGAIVPLLQQRARRQDKLDEWARQDELARRSNNIAKVAVAQNKQIIAKQDEIHAMVNSDKTSALIRERDGLLTQLALLTEIGDLRDDPRAQQVIDITRERLAALDVEIAQRSQDEPGTD